MIKLFNIPTYKIDTKSFDNILNGKIVREFEEKFCEYVGGQYAVSVNSATSGIFLTFLALKLLRQQAGKNGLYNNILIPSICPPVVANAVHMFERDRVIFDDNIEWVGSSYTLYEDDTIVIYDSAHEVIKDKYKDHNKPYVAIFSHYPTKVVGSTNLGTIVTNDLYVAQLIKSLSNNGMSNVPSNNSWEKEYLLFGYKMHGDSIASYIAYQNLLRVDHKKEKLAKIRQKYNLELGYNNISDHLYRINVNDNTQFRKYMYENQIECGYHYKPLHTHGPTDYKYPELLPKSLQEGRTTVSLPFHEKLTKDEIDRVLKAIYIYNARNTDTENFQG